MDKCEICGLSESDNAVVLQPDGICDCCHSDMERYPEDRDIEAEACRHCGEPLDNGLNLVREMRDVDGEWVMCHSGCYNAWRSRNPEPTPTIMQSLSMMKEW